MSREDKNIRLLLTGGGTGGHLFPAVATAQEFQNQLPSTEVLFVGTKRKVDTRSLANYGFKSKSISSHGFKGKNPWELFKALMIMPLSCIQAMKIVRKFDPDIIFAVGGYVTAPVVAAGKTFGVPVVLHEQNSVPGMANRKLGKLADRVCLSLPGSGAEFPAEKRTYTGNPIRSNILALAAKKTEPGEGKTTLLILGGSQGATAINKLLPRALADFTKQELNNLKVIHQTGDNDFDYVKKEYEAIGIEADVQAFFIKMEDVYSQADLLVSRAGATTLSEIAVLGKPAIFIPYPYAADDHQAKNGEYYVSGGGAMQFIQSELTATKLGETIKELIHDKDKLMTMGAAMKTLSFPDSAERIVACCLEEIEKRATQ